MFDDEFCNEMLGSHEIDILKERLEDIVDRLYSNDDGFPLDNDDVDCSIRAMATVLKVYVPKRELCLKFKVWGPEYVEDVINENLTCIKTIYRGWSESAAFTKIRNLMIEKDFDLLTVGDIAEFCYSDYFKLKCEEEGNVL